MSTATRAVRTLYRYRWLIYEMVLRDLRLRYRGSVFGFAWTLLNPLLFMAIYTLVFSVYLRISISHFPLFLLAGIIPWTWLAMALSQGTSAIVDGRMYVGKTLFPTEVLIVVPVLSSGINFLFSLPVVLALAVFSGVRPGPALLVLPLLILIELIFVQACVLLAASVNVFYRDLQQLVIHALTIGFYITPIFYTRSMVPARFDFLIAWNPMAHIIFAYQNILHDGLAPRASTLLYPLVFGLALLAVGHAVFVRNHESFSQYI